MSIRSAIRTRALSLLTAAVAIAVGVVPAHGRQSEDLLALLKAGHRGTRDTIRSFSASMVVEEATSGKKVAMYTSQCWRTPKQMRCRTVYPDGRVDDGLSTHSEHKQVSKSFGPNGKSVRYAAGRRPASKSSTTGDIWETMLIDFPNGNGAKCDLDRFLELSTKPPTVNRERLDGRDCLHLVAHYDDVHLGAVRLDAWFDPDASYLVRKRVLRWGQIRSESLITGFRQVGGVSLPEACVGQMFAEGKALGPVHATFSDVRVNEPIPVNVFQLPIPSGTIVFDDFEKTYYPVNSRWERTGPSTPRSHNKIAPPLSDGQDTTFTRQTDSEPPPGVNWLMWSSLALLASVASFWGYHRLKQAKPQGG
jgi:hypothetical protein